MESKISWSCVESLLQQLLSNEKWNVMTAADAQEQYNRRESLVLKIKSVHDSLAEDAWKYRELSK